MQERIIKQNKLNKDLEIHSLGNTFVAETLVNIW